MNVADHLSPHRRRRHERAADLEALVTGEPVAEHEVEAEARERMERGRPPKGSATLHEDTGRADAQAGAAVGVSGRLVRRIVVEEFAQDWPREMSLEIDRLLARIELLEQERQR